MITLLPAGLLDAMTALGRAAVHRVSGGRGGAAEAIAGELSATELRVEEFDAFSRKAPTANFVQSGLTVRIAQARGRDPLLLGVKRGPELVAAGAFFLHRDRMGVLLADCQKGPLLDYDDPELLAGAMRAFAAALRARGVAAVTVSPNVDRYDCDIDGAAVNGGCDHAVVDVALQRQGWRRGSDAPKPSNPATTFVKDIRELHTRDAALASCDHRTRKAVHKAEKNGVVVAEAGAADLDRAYAALGAAKSAKGAHDHQAKDYYAAALRLAGPGEVHLVTGSIDVAAFRARTRAEVAALAGELDRLENHPSMRNRRQIPAVQSRLDAARHALTETDGLPEAGDAIAAVLFVIAHGDTVTGLVGGTVPEYAYFNAFTLAYFEMLAWAVEHGYSTFDFYGTWGWDDPLSDGYGNYRFKRGFGGRVRVLLGEYETTLRPLPYAVHRLGTAALRLARRGRRAIRRA